MVRQQDIIWPVKTGPRAGEVCPKCYRADIVAGELGLYCPRCGWYPTWRDKGTK